MTEKTNVPEIRFAGFTDPWEQRKFADFVTASGIRNSENLELPSYSVTNDRGFVPQDEQFENGGTMREADKTSYWIVEPKSFAYNPARINVGSIGYQSTSGNVIVSSLYEVFQTDETCDNRFLWHWFKTRLFTRQIEMLQEGGVRLYFFFDKLLKSGISMPSVDEQRLIGEQFDRIDRLITLHQRKHDKLVQLKKSMLDKMFPKPGEAEPEIRFAGFTDPWEQRKLGELLLFQNGFNGSSESFGSGIPLISVMDVLDDEFITHETIRGKARLNYEEASRYCVEYGDVLFQRSSENQEDAGTSNVYLDQHVPSAFGGFVIRGKKVDEYNPIFIKYLLGSSFIRKQIIHRAQGAQHINVSQDTLADVVLLMPSTREQEAVGLVFLHLANLITLHQRKLELLRNTKKSLLERMFV